jgi:hypothetical protein
MTATQMETKNNKGNNLNVFHAGNDNYMVESSQGKIFYKVFLNGSRTCTCGDYVSNVQKDPSFLCKHILAAIGLVSTGNNGTGKKLVLDDRFIKSLKEKDFVLYSGLLDLAHQKGLKSITVEAIQFPTKENGMEAICKATTVAANGEVFVDWGDANPRNVNPTVANHVLRMASTRAKARTLRDFTNIGMTCLEELGGTDDDIPGDDKQKGKPRKDYNQQKAEGKVDEKTNQTQATAQSSEKKKDTVNNTGVPSQEGSPKEAPPANHQPQTPPAAHKENSEKNVNQKAKVSEAQMTAIRRLKDMRSIPDDQLHEMFQTQFGIPFVDITGDEAKVFIRSLQQAA